MPTESPTYCPPGLRVAGPAAIAYGIASLLAATLEAIVVDFSIVSPADLVADVTTLEVPWQLAQLLFIVQQPLLVFVVLGVWGLTPTGPRVPLIFGTAMLAVSGLLFGLSGLFHGVYGGYVSSLAKLTGEERMEAERLYETLHGLGDTSYYLAIAATATAMIAWLPVMRRSSVSAGGVLPRGLRWLAADSGVLPGRRVRLLRAPGLALTAAVGIACQAAWFIWLGMILRRATSLTTAR